MRELVKSLCTKVANGKVSLAVAPELPGAAEAIKALTEAGVNIRIGHSSATLAEAAAGVKAGANIAIHTYNAMSALNHREPGMVGAAMTNENLYAEIICDLVHVHPDAVKILIKARGPENVILITDCMSAGGLADGEYTLGELPVFVKDGECRLKDGTLAGSTARLIDCVKNARESAGVSLEDAVTMATATPAKAMGIFDRAGSLEEGKQADIIAIDENYNVRFVMVDGTVKIPCESGS
jgi:N-acetylglucosamine-6-phosphate deacetylase